MHQFGPSGDVKIARTGARILSVLGNVGIHGALAAQNLSIDGMSLTDYIAKVIDAEMKQQNESESNDKRKKDGEPQKPESKTKSGHMPVLKDKRTPAMAAKIVAIQDAGSLQLNLAGDTRASGFYGAKDLKPTLIVDKALFPTKASSSHFEASQLHAKVFPLFSDGTLQLSPDKQALFSDAEYWVGDNKIFQHFHFGFEDAEGKNNILWGYATFTYTGLPEPGAFKYNSTGYQHEDFLVCLGSYQHCKSAGKKYFEDEPYFNDLRFDNPSTKDDGKGDEAQQ